jgi:IgGFc binding protein
MHKSATSAWPVLVAALTSLSLLQCSANSSDVGNTHAGGGGSGGGTGAAGGVAGGAASGGVSFGGGGTGTGGSPDCANADQKTSSGCDYYAVDPEIIFDAAGGCYAAYVVNPWDFDITVSVDFKGQTLDASTFGYIPIGSGPGIQYTPLVNSVVPAGQIAILFLNRFGFSPLGLNTDCPPGIVPAISTSDAATHGTAMGAAFHIATSAPVVAYDIYPYGGGQSALTSATLLLPTTSWGTNYVAVSAFGDVGIPLPIGPQPVLDIVAHEDGTKVTISPTADIAAGAGIAGTVKGTPVSYTLNKGQVLQFTQGLALDGSVIESTVPVGVWGGMSALGIEDCCDDSAHQQIPPIRALGSEYVGVRYRNRYDGQEESPPWRMVGAVDGTTLTWEPAAPAGAPTSLNLGQVAQFDAPGPFVVKAQDDKHPFYISAHMTGAGKFDPDPQGSSDGRGDAEFVNVIPPGEYLDRYVFFTDPTYPETNLVIVREKGATGFADVTLDCAGVLTGWKPVGNPGTYEYTRVDLVRHNFQPQGNCDNGRHEITSPLPFGLTVWGWGSAETGQALSGFYSQYVSYAYPGGASVAPINDVYVPPIPR